MTQREAFEEDEAALLPYLTAQAKLPSILNTSSNPLTKEGRPKVVGDPYAGFAKGPSDIPFR